MSKPHGYGQNDWWAIKGTNGFIYSGSLSCTRSGAIKNYCKIFFSSTWKQHYRRGDRCVKVIIKEVK